MNEWKEAIPVEYDLDSCRVFHGNFSDKPPLRVREGYDGSDRRCIVIEFQNDLKKAQIDLGLLSAESDTHTRLSLFPSCARKLCAQLVEELADAGDPIANRMRHHMRQAMNELKPLKDLTNEDFEE